MMRAIVWLALVAIFLSAGFYEGAHNLIDGVAPSAFFGIAIAVLVLGIGLGD